MKKSIRDFTFSIPWNLGLLTLAAFLIATSIKAIALDHQFICGGISGLSLLFYYSTHKLSPSIWFFLLNIPVFVLGLIFVSRRFFLYSLFGMLAMTFFLEVINFRIIIHDHFLAALSYGCIAGAGGGIAFRTLGSTGGASILTIILHQKFNLRIGQTNFLFNFIIFALSFAFLDTDLVLFSLAAVFVSSFVSEYFMSLFNQRKMVLIISNSPDAIAKSINENLRRGSTLIYGEGAYTGQRKKIVMTVVNNIQLKRLEEIIFSIDPEAFVIFENTLNVIGRGFSKRKVY
ncbi:YitT family protein [Desulfohalobiaceae bacterium Ax17]|uniref:YitT family protein n=1 Tax=Desulfovulcanus ferrireducens TaxID=2831190 RepID=UPI00207B9ADA|nr:YitT family protein [Desulfovulcanus ferrireducens]